AQLRGRGVSDVPGEQMERAFGVTQGCGIAEPILTLSAGTFGLMEKPLEVLTCCLSIPWLVSAADDNVHAGPTRRAKVVAPPSEQHVQLLEFDAHGELRGLESV